MGVCHMALPLTLALLLLSNIVVACRAGIKGSSTGTANEESNPDSSQEESSTVTDEDKGTEADSANKEQDAPDASDKTPPGRFQISSPSAITMDTTPEVMWTQAADAVGYNVRVDNSPSCDSPAQTFNRVNALKQVLSPLGAGTWYVCVTAYDLAGNNTDAANNAYSFVIDTTPPASFSITLPAAVINDTTPDVTWEAASDAATYTLLIDDASDCATPAQTYSALAATDQTLTALSDGTWYVCVTAYDLAGNTTDAANNAYSFVIDTTAALISDASVTTASPGRSLTPSVAFTVNENANVTLYSDSSCLTTISSSTAKNTGANTMTTDSLIADTTTAIFVQAIDAAANTSDCVSAGAYINDRTPPTDPTTFLAMPGYNRVYASWGGAGAGTAGYSVLYKSGSALTWTPTDGYAYATGEDLGAGRFVAFDGSASSEIFNSLSGGTPYHYKLFAYDSLRNFTTSTLGRAVTPSTNLLVGSAGGPVKNLVLSGSYIYGIGTVLELSAAARTTVPQALVVIDPSTQRVIASQQIYGGRALNVAAANGYVFVTSETNGVMIFDVSTPQRPLYVGAYSVSFTFSNGVFPNLAVTLDANTLYLQTAATTFQIVNVTSKTSPALVSTYTRQMTGNIFGLALSGEYVYLTLGTTDLEVVDVSNSSFPTKAASYESGTAYGRICNWGCNNISVNGNYAYVSGTGTNRGTLIIDVSTPTAPTQAGFAAATNYDPRANVVNGTTLYVVESDENQYGRLEIYDVSDPANIPAGTEVTLPASTIKEGAPSSVVVSGSNIFVSGWAGKRSPATGNTALTSFGSGITMVQGGAVVGYVPNIAFASQVIVSGNYTFIRDDNLGVVIMDSTDPSRPAPLTYYATTESGSTAGNDGGYNGAKSMALNGDTIYLTPNHEREVHVVDVSAKTAPAYLGFKQAALTYVYDFGVNNGSYFYTGTCSSCSSSPSFSDMKIFDLSDPANIPDNSSQAVLATTTYAVVNGSYLYTASGASGVGIYDVSTPTIFTLQNSSTASDTPAAKHLRVAGNYMYVADTTNGLVIYDVTSKTEPAKLSTLAVPSGNGNFVKVALNGNYLAAGTDTGMFYLINVTDKANPSVAASLQLYYDSPTYEFRDIQANGHYFYVAYGQGGLLVLDATP
jgi:hypothetical protein